MPEDAEQGSRNRRHNRARTILYPDSGDIAQFAVNKVFIRMGIGSMLMKTLSIETSRGKLGVVNVDRSSTDTLNFLTDLRFKNFAAQYEMILEL